MELKIFLAYLVTDFLLSATPGPAVLLISSQGLKHGAKTSFYGAMGISTGNLVYFLLSALGLGALIVKAAGVFDVIKILGATYLVIAGIKILLDSFKKKQDSEQGAPSSVLSVRGRKAFFQAFVTQISNPKAIIFFVSFLPQFVDPKRDIWLQLSILAAATIVIETSILFFYGWISARSSAKIKSNVKVSQWIDRFAGTALVAIGINLFFMKKE